MREHIMDILLHIATLHTLARTAMAHITIVEVGLLGLCLLVFMLIFIMSFLLWRYRLMFFLCCLLELGTLACAPFAIAFLSTHMLYPINVKYNHAAPFVYTSGFSYELEIYNLSKLTITECMLTLIPLRENPKGSMLIRIKDMLTPLNAYTQILRKRIAPKESVLWSGIIERYRYGEHFSLQVDCH